MPYRQDFIQALVEESGQLSSPIFAEIRDCNCFANSKRH
jgi:hypothetical protein